MPWWSWIIIGTLLLAAELLAVDAQFYLVFIGIAAIIVGLTGPIGFDFPLWLQWLSFAVLALVLMFTLRRKLYDTLHNRPIGTVDGDAGRRVAITEELEPGRSCRAEYRGSTWTAVNVGERAIPAGTDAQIESVDGLTLRVRAALDAARSAPSAQ
jgi:inner membrane protein